MRTVLLVTLLVANAIGFALVTNPARRELAELERRSAELQEASANRSAQADQWKELHALVRLAQSTLQPIPVESNNVQLSALQAALLDAEESVAIRRSSMDIRLEGEVPAGFRGFRVNLEAEGDFASVYTYLDRVSRLGAPMALVEMSLGREAPSSQLLSLAATWTTLWPE